MKFSFCVAAFILQWRHFLCFQVCNTPGCKKLSAFLTLLVNKSANPCEDFYSFSCGRWESENHGRSVDEFSSEIVNGVVQAGLAAVDLRSKKVPKAIKYAKRFYEICKTFDPSDEVTQFELLDLVQNFANWPFFNKTWHGADFDIVEVTGRLIGQLGLSTLVTLSIGLDLYQHFRNALYIQPATLANDLSKYNETLFPEFKGNYIKNVSRALQQLAVNVGVRHLNVRGINEIAKEIVEFEDELADHILSEGEQASENQDMFYNPKTLAELNSIYNSTEGWRLFFKAVFRNEREGMEYIERNKIIVTQTDYFNYLAVKVNESEPTVTKIAANYLLWRLLASLGPHFAEDFLKIETENLRAKRFFDIKELSFQNHLKEPELPNLAKSPLELSCQMELGHLYEDAIARIYVEKQFSQEKLEGAKKMVENVQLAMKTAFERVGWISELSRSRMLDKLMKMQKNIGYPQWLLNNTELDSRYRDKRVRSNATFTKTLIGLNRFPYHQLFITIDRTYFAKPVTTINNAAYVPVLNSITIPAGQLEYPFYDTGFPDAFNYATIGSTIGHELAHGFDREGIKYDADGNKTLSELSGGSWLLGEANETFHRKSQCLIGDFSHYCYKFIYLDPQIAADYLNQTNSTFDPTFLCINGDHTLSENIADLEGLKIAYRAYKNLLTQSSTTGVKSDSRIPEFEDYDMDQLFFLGYGAAWCNSYTSDKLKGSLASDEHSPPDARVNVILKNMREFSDTFKCKPKDKMYASRPCSLYT